MFIFEEKNINESQDSHSSETYTQLS